MSASNRPIRNELSEACTTTARTEDRYARLRYAAPVIVPLRLDGVVTGGIGSPSDRAGSPRKSFGGLEPPPPPSSNS
jgi:hypothetical protein